VQVATAKRSRSIAGQRWLVEAASRAKKRTQISFKVSELQLRVKCGKSIDGVNPKAIIFLPNERLRDERDGKMCMHSHQPINPFNSSSLTPFSPRKRKDNENIYLTRFHDV
jgi:hypothetical protein